MAVAYYHALRGEMVTILDAYHKYVEGFPSQDIYLEMVEAGFAPDVAHAVMIIIQDSHIKSLNKQADLLTKVIDLQNTLIEVAGKYKALLEKYNKLLGGGK